MFSSSEEHPKTRHEIKIARRVCRYLLISMKEQDKQLLNVHVACFADHTLTDPVELEGAAAYDKAWAFMTEIGGKFLRDEITPATIKATAKTMMESRGIPTRVPNHISKIVKKNLKKKPEGATKSDAICKKPASEVAKKTAASEKAPAIGNDSDESKDDNDHEVEEDTGDDVESDDSVDEARSSVTASQIVSLILFNIKY